MAYQIILRKRFITKSIEIAEWIEKEWSKSSADKFSAVLHRKIQSLQQTPFTGMITKKNPKYRKLVITKHNKVYYTVKGKKIYIVDILESKQNPKKTGTSKILEDR